MAQYESFHCRIKITRNVLQADGTYNPVTSYFRFFASQSSTPYFSIGSSTNADFVVDNLMPIHCKFKFGNDSLLVVATGEIDISGNDQEQSLSAGELLRLPFALQQSASGQLLLWQLKIGKQLHIRGVVELEKDLLSLEAKNALTELYGRLIQVDAGKTSLIYLVPKEYVLKVLRPSYIHKKRGFLQGARQWQKLSGSLFPNILSIQSYPIPHVCMQYFYGQSLQNYTARKGILASPDVLSLLNTIAKKLFRNLEISNRCNVLTLENIIQDKNGDLKIIGPFMGIANFLASSPHSSALKQYLAPEILQECCDDYALANVFSLGVLLYQLLLGKFPFTSTDNYLQAIAKNAVIDGTTLQSQSSQLTYQVVSLLEAMLSFSVTKRMQPERVISSLQEICDLVVWETSLAILDELEQQKKRFCLQVCETANKGQLGKIFFLPSEGAIVIGRAGEIAITDAQISRHHAQLTIEGEQCTLKDLNSKNAILIDKQAVSQCRITNGDSFTLGTTTLRFWDYQKMQHAADRKTKKEFAMQGQAERELPSDNLPIESEIDGVADGTRNLSNKVLHQFCKTIALERVASPSKKNDKQIKKSK